MNRKEYCNTKHKYYKYYNQVQKLLKDWKAANNITERCVVHHRDDTDETIKYNEEHYELWGVNEDGTFEPGKYVQFLTATEHIRHHRSGIKRSECTKPTTIKISTDAQKMLKVIKTEYQNRYHRNISFEDIILQKLQGGIDDRINLIINECL